MASKTSQFTIQMADGWVRIDASQPIQGGKVIQGPCQIEYCTSQPAVTDLGVPFVSNEPFSISIATGDQVWAKASTPLGARIAVWQRAAS